MELQQLRLYGAQIRESITMKHLHSLLLAGSFAVVFIVGCAANDRDPDPIPLSQVPESSESDIGPIDLENITEVDLVEQIARVRNDYRRLLKILRKYYLNAGYYQKSRWALRELEDLENKVKTYPYLTVVDVHNTQEHDPTHNIPQADALYNEALELYRQGQILPFMNDKTKLKQSLAKFKQVMNDYPNSDKIDDAAFYAGEISKEYFNDNDQAVNFYKLAMKWNPQTPHPVRFQCAVIYEYRLHDRRNALEMYRRVLDEERELDPTNTAWAAARVKALTETPAGDPANAQPPADLPPEPKSVGPPPAAQQ